MGLSQYKFSYDSGTGTLVNSTAVLFSGTTNTANATVTLPSTVGMKFQWRFYVEATNGLWNATNTMCSIPGRSGTTSATQFVTISDDCYDMLAYDGTDLYNLGTLPQFMPTGSFTGWHTVQWNAAKTQALLVGYNNAIGLYSGGVLTPLSSGLPSGTNIDSVAWRPVNGSNFALITADGGYLLTYHNGVMSRIVSGTSNGLAKLAWSPDGSYALIAATTVLLKYAYSTGTITLIPTPVHIGGMTFAPNGQYAMMFGGPSTENETLWRYADSTGSFTQIVGTNRLHAGCYDFQTVAFSLDGAYVLLTSRNVACGDLVMWTASANTFSNVTSSITNTANQIAFAPYDSYALVTTTAGSLLKQMYGATTATVIPLTDNRLRGIDFYVS